MTGIRDKQKLVEAVKSIWKLGLDGKINKDIEKEIMNLLIWKIGEIPKKYEIPLWTEEALKIKENGENKREQQKNLHHEHVIPRKRLKEELVNAKTEQELKDIIKKIRTCIVTRTEHKELGNGEGWERYKKAGKKVYNIYENKQEPLKFD